MQIWCLNCSGIVFKIHIFHHKSTITMVPYIKYLWDGSPHGTVFTVNFGKSFGDNSFGISPCSAFHGHMKGVSKSGMSKISSGGGRWGNLALFRTHGNMADGF